MKVAVVLTRIPFPLMKGDKLRAYYQIKELAKQHEVYLFCLNYKDEEEIYDENAVCVIEWSHFIEYALPSERLEISITIDGENRIFTLNPKVTSSSFCFVRELVPSIILGKVSRSKSLPIKLILSYKLSKLSSSLISVSL